MNSIITVPGISSQSSKEEIYQHYLLCMAANLK